MSTLATESARTDPRRRNLIFAVCVGSLVFGFLLMPDFPTLREDIGYGLRLTARVAFVFLMLAYVARPIVQLFGIGRWLLINRRYLGLSMALAHTVHFGFVVALAVEEPLEPFILVFGGAAFVLLWMMAATSNNASVRALGKNWKRLHLIGLHYLWIVFFVSFLGRVGAQDPYYLYALLSAVALAGLGLRGIAFWQARRQS